MTEQKLIWLVRTANNVISGPYNKEQVAGLIRDGKLSSQDEVCQSCDQWIYLHEREEILSRLGVEVPLKGTDNGDDNTQVVDTVILNRAEPNIPDLPAADSDFNPERTGVMVRSLFGRAEVKQAKALSGKSSDGTPTPAPIPAGFQGRFKRGSAVIHQPQAKGMGRKGSIRKDPSIRRMLILLGVLLILILIAALNILP